MGHHSSDSSKEFLRQIEEARSLFGATGRFPEGKIDPSDEGELRFGIAHRDGQVIVQFGKPVAWFALGPAQARELAALLQEHADSAAKAAFQDPQKESNAG